MYKVVLLSAVLIQFALTGCGNKSNNAGVTPQACGAAGGPSQVCVPAPNANNAYGGNAMNGPQGYGYYSRNGFFVPSYQNVQTGCGPGSQPILTQAGTMSCVQTSMFQQFGQPVYQENYQWDQQSQSQDPNQMQGQYQDPQYQNQNPGQYENQQYQNQQFQGQNRHQVTKVPGPAVECSTSNPCQTGFCQPLQSAPAAGYCRAS